MAENEIKPFFSLLNKLPEEAQTYVSCLADILLEPDEYLKYKSDPTKVETIKTELIELGVVEKDVVLILQYFNLGLGDFFFKEIKKLSPQLKNIIGSLSDFFSDESNLEVYNLDDEGVRKIIKRLEELGATPYYQKLILNYLGLPIKDYE